MINPCHSLTGRLVTHRRGPKGESERWVLIETDGGEIRKTPKIWTSLAPLDPYQLLSRPPLLRLAALRELADFVALRREDATKRKGSK